MKWLLGGSQRPVEGCGRSAQACCWAVLKPILLRRQGGRKRSCPNLSVITQGGRFTEAAGRSSQTVSIQEHVVPSLCEETEDPHSLPTW